MASDTDSPKIDQDSPASTTKMIEVAYISIPAYRLRALQSDKVTAIAESIASPLGLLHPIVVRPCGPYGSPFHELIAGWHRLEAAKTLGWKTIAATVFAADDTDQAVLAEIDENLCRAELSPAERALHIGQRKQLYEKLHPGTKHGGDHKSAQAKSTRQVGDLNRFTRDTAERTGQSERVVQRDAQRAENVVVLSDIVRTPLDTGTELDALAQLPAAEQQQLAERARTGEAVTAKAAKITKTTKTASAIQPPTAAALEEAQVRNVERHANFMPADAAPAATTIKAVAKLDPESWRAATPDERTAFLRANGAVSFLNAMPESWRTDVRKWVMAEPGHHEHDNDGLDVPGFLRREPTRRLN